VARPTTAPMPVSAVVLVELASTLILPPSLPMQALLMAASVEQPVDRALQIAADTTPVRQAVPTTVAPAVVAIALLPATPAPQAVAADSVAVVVAAVTPAEAADVANQRIHG